MMLRANRSNMKPTLNGLNVKHFSLWNGGNATVGYYVSPVTLTVQKETAELYIVDKNNYCHT